MSSRSKRSGGRNALRPKKSDGDQNGAVADCKQGLQSVISVCTSGACWQDGAQATLIELEELASVAGGTCKVHEYSCFGRCGRGPNASIDWSDGTEQMCSGLRTLEKSVATIKRATGRRQVGDTALLTRLTELRRVSNLEQELMSVQSDLDVLDCMPSSKSSASGIAKLNAALAKVDGVIAAAGDAHPKLLAQAVRRQVLASRDGRPVSPGTADVCADDPAHRRACWRVEGVQPVSRHSAVFTLRSDDPTRGSARLKREGGGGGGGGGELWAVSRGGGGEGSSSSSEGGGGESRTWHVRLLVEGSSSSTAGGDGAGADEGGGEGGDNGESSSVEREYTPISSEVDWDNGEVGPPRALDTNLWPCTRQASAVRACAVRVCDLPPTTNCHATCSLHAV